MAVIERRPSTHEPSPPWGAPPEPPRRRRFTGIAVAVAVLAVAVAGGLLLVNRPAHKAAPVTTNTQPSTPAASTPAASNPAVSTPQPTTIAQATTAAVVAGYKAEQAAFQAVINNSPVDPTDQRLPSTMTGDRLAAVRNAFTVLALQGQHGVGTADLAPVVIAVSGTTATVTDCLFDHGRIVDRVGQTVSGPDTQRTLEKVTLRFESGVWKVAGFEKVGAGCVPAA
jgi:hypothetical protein